MANDYFIYTVQGHETFSGLCATYGVTTTDVIRMNAQEYQGKTLGQFLASTLVSGNKTLPSGLEIKLPYRVTGGQEVEPPKYDTRLEALSKTGQKFSGAGSSAHSSLKSRAGNSMTTHWKDFDCYMYVLLDGTPQSTWYLPVFPNEFADANAASFSAISILGRSVDHQIYQGSSRTPSFTLTLHDELCPDHDYVHELVAQIESACYPGYSGGVVKVPEVCFVIGKQFKVRGILGSVGASWTAPIIDGKLVNCSLSISMTETTGPYSRSEIARMGGYRK